MQSEAGGGGVAWESAENEWCDRIGVCRVRCGAAWFTTDCVFWMKNLAAFCRRSECAEGGEG